MARLARLQDQGQGDAPSPDTAQEGSTCAGRINWTRVWSQGLQGREGSEGWFPWARRAFEDQKAAKCRAELSSCQCGLVVGMGLPGEAELLDPSRRVRSCPPATGRETGTAPWTPNLLGSSELLTALGSSQHNLLLQSPQDFSPDRTLFWGCSHPCYQGHDAQG